jgi:hypothetical protein
MYKLIILEINANADAKYFSKWLKDNYALTYKGLSIGGKVIIQFSAEPSEADKATITDRYQSLTADDVLVLENIIITYEKRTEDGQNYYDQVRGDLAIQYNAGTLSMKDANYIEVTKLSVVKSLLITGDWATAQYEVDNNVVTEGTVSKTDIDNGFTQAMYNDIKTGIDTYVKENY